MLIHIIDLSQKVGYEPDVILAGRKVNDNMGLCGFATSQSNDKK